VAVAAIPVVTVEPHRDPSFPAAPIRTLFFTHRLPYAPNRGDRIRAYHELHAIRSLGPVDLVSFVHDEEERRHAADLAGVAASVTIVEVPRTRNLCRAAAALPGRTPLTHLLLDAPDLPSTLGRLVSQRQPDVILAYCSGTARLAMLPPLHHLPLIVDMVDADSAKWAALGRTSRPPRSWIYRREANTLAAFERRVMSRAVATVVVNERERTELLRICPGARVSIVQNGIDVTPFNPPGPPSSEPVVSFCGVMNYAPNVDAAERLARAIWPMVRQRRPDAKLLVVGSNPSRAVLRLAAEPGVEVTGAVDDVRPYLWRSALSAAPLETARGVQNKVLEALAAGLPAVVSPAVAGGLPGSARPGCIECDSDESFATAITRLLDAPPSERRRRASLANLRNLEWPGQLRPLLAILKRAAAGVPPRIL
jgi:sugar transferase (PEP-CTERM/EpsH1 system associated)